jgi:hypothetical protein
MRHRAIARGKTVTGTSGSLTHSANVTLKVQ